MSEKQTYTIFDLPSSTNEITGNELIELSTPVGNEYYDSRKETINNLSDWLGNYLNINELNTDNKTIISAINELSAAGNNAAAHNSIYRGQWLGIAPTQAQYEAIFNGTFDDMYIGDFWSEDPNDATKTRWRIACFNYYQYTGNQTKVLTNHAVIIPDVCLSIEHPYVISNEGLDSMGGYKYTFARGYKNIQEQYQATEGQTVFHVNHIPEYVFYVKTRLSVPTTGSNQGFDVLWEVDPENSGEDPNNPGQGIITIYGGTRYVLVGGSGVDIMPSFNGMPANAWPYFGYAYKEDNYGSLYECKQIINQVFGANHIMHHEIPLTTYTIGGNKQGLYTGSFYKKIWTDIDIELPTLESIMGNSSVTCYNEYLYDEVYHQTLKHIPEYIDISTYPIDYCNPPYNSPESHVEMSQLPLFLYDPALIHTRKGYWFRNIGQNDNDQYIAGWLNDYSYQVKYMFITGEAELMRYTTYGSYSNVGIRPMFCISNTTEPNILPGGGV